MATAYTDIESYRSYSGDESTPDARVQHYIDAQSAALRAELRIAEGYELSEDAATLAEDIVLDACRKALVPAHLEGFGDVYGATQASFSADGFSASVSTQNPSGAAYFDRSMLARLKRLVGRTQRIGTIAVGW